MKKPILRGQKAQIERWHAIELDTMPPLPSSEVKLRYSYHALKACNDDKYGNVPKYDYIPANAQIFDIMKQGNKIIRYGLKVNFDNEYDVTLVVAVNSSTDFVVVTTWKNETTDLHNTLDVSRYEATRKRS